MLCAHCSRLRTQASEIQKRKAVENSQSAADLKLHLDKYHSQLKEAQNIVAEKTSTLSQEAFKHKRIHVSWFIYPYVSAFTNFQPLSVQLTLLCSYYVMTYYVMVSGLLLSIAQSKRTRFSV